MKLDKKQLTALIITTFIIFNTAMPCLAADSGSNLLDSIKSTINNTYQDIKNTVTDTYNKITGNVDKDISKETTSTTASNPVTSDVSSKTETQNVQISKSEKQKYSTPNTSEFIDNVSAGVKSIDNLTNKDPNSIESQNMTLEGDDDGLLSFASGKKMVGEGVVYAFEFMADQAYKLGFNTTSSDQKLVKQNYGYAVAVIYTLSTLEYNPLDNPFVKKAILTTNVIGLFLIIFFVFLGAIRGIAT